MGTSDKTDKPNADQVDQDDAAILVESSDEQAHSVATPENTLPAETQKTDGVSDDPKEEVTADLGEYGVPEAQKPQRKAGFLPMVLGGVVAVVIGFGGAVYFGEQLGLGGDAESARAALKADFEAQIASQQEIISRLSAAQNKAEQDVLDGRAQTADVANRFGRVEAQTASLAAQFAELESRLDDIEKRPLTEGLSVAAIAAYEREVQDLKELVVAQKAAASDLKDKADLSAQAALSRSSVSRIIAALDSGSPYRAAIVDLRSASGDEVSAVLEAHADKGVATLAGLIESFPDQARSALAQARADNSAGDTGGKIGNFFKTHLGARSVEAREGSDVDAVLSRAEAALRQGDLKAVLTELDGLAEGPKTVMSEWIDLAQTRLQATQAAEELAQRLNSN